ncbi:hypothetical protein FJV41_18565 [Myxococcus llanfairpwllgwyngyllgogerychwyrndrobwllllantysiliogogogochensis]|uniref:Uncharacterized protein n=1 Tax=Myxococcus llanfairpwllgwyngyllgogerychwyrndrobwllllantysiliogogogochensis TaxID=2590453 RepID=A0A540WZL8_9BACT|nr:hypothetical protein [Myxococcus llanfairpwllgwyngyllgogerychwyrndrobwllllantysiliogogogochensis]TQF14451.1 hypothetical protein FJV41_18565 [Myxococcus llanfairpwllgwyngyllgogerychwyrndrobwllllantysiliogogogochensis]
MKPITIAFVAYLAVTGADAPASSFELVSLVRLLAAPEAYDGKRIQVVGYGSFDSTGTALYLNAQDHQHGVPMSAVWLVLGQTGAPKAGSPPGYVVVRGTFRAEGRGAMGLFSGAITDIDRLEDWVMDSPALPTQPKNEPTRTQGCR